MSTPSNPPAGFYDDGQGRQRWFDGTKWTEQYQVQTTTPPAPAIQTAGPATAASLNVKREVIYNRAQKGHSIILWILLGAFVLWIPAIYYSVSPNHYWHA